MINLNKAMKFLSVCLFTAAVGACATSGVVGESDPSGEKSELIEIQNKSLAKKVSIQNFKTRVVNDLLNVQVEIESQFSSTQEFQYKFSWFDATGFEVEGEANSWRTLILTGKETKTVQAVAPNPTAKKYRMVLREL